MARLDVRGQTAQDTYWSLLDQGLGLVSSTLSFLLLGRSLAATGYGAFVGLYALIGPFLSLGLPGVTLAILEDTVRDREDPDDVARSCMSLTLATATVTSPIVIAIALMSIKGISARTIVLLVLAELLLGAVFHTSVAIVQAARGFSPAARLRMKGTASRIALIVGLSAMGQLTLPGLALGQIVTLGLATAYALGQVKALRNHALRPGRIRRNHLRSSFVYGVGLAASGTQNDGDKFVLNAAGYQADAGRYGAAYRLVQIAMLPIQALAGATHLSFLKVQDGPNDQLARAVRLAGLTLAYVVPAILGLIVVAPWVPLLLTRSFDGTPEILRLLSPLLILRGLGVFPMNGLLGFGRNDLRTRILVGNALLSVALYVAVIPRHSWSGALLATMISETSLFLSAWLTLSYCQYRHNVASRRGVVDAAADSSVQD